MLEKVPKNTENSFFDIVKSQPLYWKPTQSVEISIRVIGGTRTSRFCLFWIMRTTKGHRTLRDLREISSKIIWSASMFTSNFYIISLPELNLKYPLLFSPPIYTKIFLPKLHSSWFLLRKVSWLTLSNFTISHLFTLYVSCFMPSMISEVMYIKISV